MLLTDAAQALKKSLLLRLERWEEFRRFIALRTKIIFQYHLSQRGYYGKVLFDHQKQTLNLKVTFSFIITKFASHGIHRFKRKISSASERPRARRKIQGRSVGARNRSLRFACCWRCGRQSDARLGVLTSSMFSWMP
jgi:hypothetical protein